MRTLTSGRFLGFLVGFFAHSSTSYLGSFYSEAQRVGGAHALSPLHVARLGDASLGMLLGARPPAVHLHHFVVQVLPGFGPFASPYQLLLQVCSETTGERASQASSWAGCLHTRVSRCLEFNRKPCLLWGFVLVVPVKEADRSFLRNQQRSIWITSKNRSDILTFW